MFLNILKISALDILRTFLNIIVSIGCVFIIFHSHKPTGSTKTIINLPLPLPARKGYNNILKKK